MRRLSPRVNTHDRIARGYSAALSLTWLWRGGGGTGGGRRMNIASIVRRGQVMARATAAELMEVFELASGIGIESFALALPALAEAEA